MIDVVSPTFQGLLIKKKTRPLTVMVLGCKGGFLLSSKSMWGKMFKNNHFEFLKILTYDTYYYICQGLFKYLIFFPVA